MGPSAASPTTRSRSGDAGRGSSFALLSSDFLDELRARTTLSALVSRTVPLKKAGNEFKACCPFHKERTPSFWVNDQKGFYHCFGCGAHGDAIRFLTDARGTSFREAVQELADAAGLELPKPSKEAQERQARTTTLRELLQKAVEFYRRTFLSSEGALARDYLVRRGILNETAEAYSIGYAPDDRHRLSRELTGIDPKQLIEAGLVIQVEERAPYDRFRDRVMVPIHDSQGRVIAFGGRILGAGEPKYLNSPDTPVFDKGRVLFNLHRAAPASRQTERLIVVEGYMDVIALGQAGIRESVAPMGTALTEAQLEQLWQQVDQPIFCFDGDSAGHRASVRAAERALAALRPGKQIAVAMLPSGKDPDDLIREGGREAFEHVVSHALPIAEFLYASEAGKIDRNRAEERAGLRKRLEDLAGTCSDRLMKQEFIRSFNDLFFEDFGWKKKYRQAITSAVVNTSERVDAKVYRLYVRSALFGLTRFPRVAAANIEALLAIPLTVPHLQRWRDSIAEAVLERPDLDDDGVKAILDARLLPETLLFDINSDLRFGFTRRSTEPSVAARQLEALVTFLAEERGIKEQLDELNKAAVEAAGEGYDVIEVARERVRQQQANLLERGANWDGSLH
jgi:DNA primase